MTPLSQPPSTYCLTIGDPTGIGPEITARLLHELALTPEHHQNNPFKLIVLGDILQLNETACQYGLELPRQRNHQLTVEYVHVEGNGPGATAYLALEKAVKCIRDGQASALVTGPISKENLRSVGIPFEGHTEILQYLTNLYFKSADSASPWQSEMLFVYRQFRMLLLTRHVALKDVSTSLDISSVSNTLQRAIRFLRQYERIETPRLCVLGVNPHAGEINGHEERDILMPAISTVSKQENVDIDPPCAADALFREFNVDHPGYDLFVSPYHDQGLIPMKLLAGFRAVNVTIGLPFIRTSVSHGMAMDIVGQGKANPLSLLEALNVAQSYSCPISSPHIETTAAFYPVI